MKVIKIICVSLIVSLFSVSCNDTKKASKDLPVVAVEKKNLKEIVVGIEGMTCEIGCAKTIESKLSKTAGVASVAVSFENKLGEIVYDANVISKEEISKKIASYAGGETYTISSLKEKSENCCAKDLSKCTMKCDAACEKLDCEKCVALQEECQEKCASNLQECCKNV
jgi:mercuric ion binding protein